MIREGEEGFLVILNGLDDGWNTLASECTSSPAEKADLGERLSRHRWPMTP